MSFFEKIGIDSSVVDRRIRVHLVAIKTAFSAETAASKEMLGTYRRYLEGQADETEMAAANRQFRSFLKAVGLGALLVLPGSFATLPAIARAAERAGIDIFPDSFDRALKTHQNDG